VHVRDVVLDDARRARLGYGLAFLDDVAPPHEQWAEMRERRLVTARRGDRDGGPVGRDLPGERHLAGCRRADDRSAVEREIDPSMLSAGVRVVADGVTAEHGSVGGPGPGERVGSRQ
jgi:hypothetical protein